MRRSSELHLARSSFCHCSDWALKLSWIRTTVCSKGLSVKNGLLILCLRCAVTWLPRSRAANSLGGYRRQAPVQVKVASMIFEFFAKLGVTAWKVLVLVIEDQKVAAKLLRHRVGDTQTGLVKMLTEPLPHRFHLPAQLLPHRFH